MRTHRQALDIAPRSMAEDGPAIVIVAIYHRTIVGRRATAGLKPVSPA
ncbi:MULTISPECIES: hypothetical protein [Paenibacillus]|nr:MULTISPECIES: hypothetical protein [Paenibacillus]